MKKVNVKILIFLLCLICFLPVTALGQNWWVCEYCGELAAGNHCSRCGNYRWDYQPEGWQPAIGLNSPYEDPDVHPMDVPRLNAICYGKESHNIYVLWVQVQMKATGRYYQGEEWDETGVLGDHTHEEIKRMMRDNGYPDHGGYVDQDVIDVLCSILGIRLEPVFVGGFYDKMHTLTSGYTYGNMHYVRNDTGGYTVGTEWVQRCLGMLGYYNGPIDGEFGSRTIVAVKAFQRDHNFQQRPYVSMGVARRMLEECFKRGCNLDQLP